MHILLSCSFSLCIYGIIPSFNWTSCTRSPLVRCTILMWFDMLVFVLTVIILVVSAFLQLVRVGEKPVAYIDN